jgi:hypothetical protein
VKWFHSRNEILKNGLAIFAVLAISIVGVKLLTTSQAAEGATMSLTSNATTIQTGSPLTVTLRVDSGSDFVNSVQASMNYDAAQLRFVSLSEGTSFDLVTATDTSTPGLIRIARGTNTPVSGAQDVVTLNFTVLATSGTASVSFDKNYSFVVDSITNSDILATAPTVSYPVTTTPVSSPTMSLSPSTGTYATDQTIAVEVKATSTGKLTTAEVGLNYPANQLQFVSVTEGGVFTTKQRTNTATPGVIDIIRAVPGGNTGVTGTNPIVTINFKVIGFDSDYILERGRFVRRQRHRQQCARPECFDFGDIQRARSSELYRVTDRSWYAAELRRYVHFNLAVLGGKHRRQRLYPVRL